MLYYLLLNFRIEPNEKTEIPLKMEKSMMAIIPLNGIELELKMRS